MTFFRRRKRVCAWEQLKDLSDLELVGQLRAENHDAVAEIVDRYRRLVFSIAMRIVKDMSEAEDVSQMVFVEMYEKLAQFDADRGTLKMWLLQITYSRSINRRNYLERRQFYTQTELSELDPFLSSGGSLRQNGMSSEEIGLVVRRAMSRLNEKQQNVVELVFFQGLTLEETANRTGDSLPAVRHQYYRGLAKMREIISAPASTLAAEESCSVGPEVSDLEPRTI